MNQPAPEIQIELTAANREDLVNAITELSKQFGKRLYNLSVPAQPSEKGEWRAGGVLSLASEPETIHSLAYRLQRRDRSLKYRLAEMLSSFEPIQAEIDEILQEPNRLEDFVMKLMVNGREDRDFMTVVMCWMDSFWADKRVDEVFALVKERWHNYHTQSRFEEWKASWEEITS
jgi:hypothetical protein